MIFLGADSHGYKTISYVKEYLLEHKREFTNLGVENNSDEKKIEVIILDVATKVRSDEKNIGILSCGTGVGVEVGVNKFSGIRGCLATNKTIAKYAIEKDKCNVLCLVGWEPNKNLIFEILDTWFKSSYDGSISRLKMFEVFNSWH
jgi:ribose 5-phosphate isomerase B